MGSETLTWMGLSLPKAQLYLAAPLLLSAWMAWCDVRTNRIPNYLTFGSALAGLGFQVGFHGWAGAGNAILGLGLGLALLIFFYGKGGMGAGDVKALAALGAWLGPVEILFLFVYMAFSGVVLILFFLWWRGLLTGKIRHLWEVVKNWALLRSQPPLPRSKAAAEAKQGERIPYAPALAMGMALLCWRRFLG